MAANEGHMPESPKGGSLDGESACFEEMTYTRGELQIVWEWIGEGWDGDWDFEDEEDTPLLRFSVYRWVDDPALRAELDGGDPDSAWVPIDDASYCTRMSLLTPVTTLRRALELMMDRIESDFHADDYSCGVRRTCEDLSWIGADEVEQADVVR